MDHRLGEIEAQPPGEHAASAPPQAAAVALCPSEPGHSPEATALDAARAEFRAAWGAKQARVERLRGYARLVDRFQHPLFRFSFAVVLLYGGVVVLSLLRGVGIREIIRSQMNNLFWMPYLLSNVLSAVAQLAKELLNQSADRLEAAEVQYPAPQRGEW